MNPEAAAREKIDAMPIASDWIMQGFRNADADNSRLGSARWARRNHPLFGNKLLALLEDLNQTLAA